MNPVSSPSAGPLVLGRRCPLDNLFSEPSFTLRLGLAHIFIHGAQHTVGAYCLFARRMIRCPLAPHVPWQEAANVGERPTRF